MGGRADAYREVCCSRFGLKGVSKRFDAHPDLIPTAGTDWVHTPRAARFATMVSLRSSSQSRAEWYEKWCITARRRRGVIGRCIDSVRIFWFGQGGGHARSAVLSDRGRVGMQSRLQQERNVYQERCACTASHVPSATSARATGSRHRLRHPLPMVGPWQQPQPLACIAALRSCVRASHVSVDV